jgi:hypothetical protein
MAEDFPYQEQLISDPQYLLTITILQSAVAIIFLFISLMIFAKYRKTKVREILDLALTLLLMGLSFLSATIPMYLAQTDPTNALISGVPIYNEISFWWTNISFLFVTVSISFLFRFMNSLFKNLKKKTSQLFDILIIMFNIWNFYQGTFNRATGSLPTEMAILFLTIGFIPWLILSFQSFKLYKQVEPSVYQTGVFLIFLSSICTVISYIVYVIHQLKLITSIDGKLFEQTYFIFYIFTAILFYIGYILPDWFKKIVGKFQKQQ